MASPQQTRKTASSFTSKSVADIDVVYYVVFCETRPNGVYPRKFDPVNKLEISSRTRALAKAHAKWRAKLLATDIATDSTWDDSTHNTSNNGEKSLMNPRPCVATFSFYGLEATLLCDYDDVTSTASNFRIVDTNDDFLDSKITGFVIDHNATDRLRGERKPLNDDLGNEFLGVEFLKGGKMVQVLAKKKNIQDALLTRSERKTLKLDHWFGGSDSGTSE